MKKIIVLGAFVNALGIIRALGKTKQYHLIAIGRDNKKNIARWSKYLNEMVCLGEKDTEIDVLLRNEDEWKNAYIIPTSDDNVRQLQINFERLSGCYTPLVDSKNIDIILSKKKFAKMCTDANIPVPKHYSSYDEIECPVIFKPENEQAKQLFRDKFNKGILVINNKSELPSLDKDVLEMSVIQQFVSGNDLFFTGGYSHKGEVKLIMVAKKIIQRPPHGGDTAVAMSVHNNQLVEYSKRLLKEIGYTGLFDIEFKYNCLERDFYVIEMNPRSAKWISFLELLGLPVIKQSIDPDQQPDKTSYKAGASWVDIYGLLGNLAKYSSARRSILKYIYYLVTARNFAVFDRKDIKPFLKRR